MSEFFEYLEQLVFEVETGRIAPAEMRARFIADWGGMHVRGYVPRKDPALRQATQSLIDSGVSPRTARRKITGR